MAELVDAPDSKSGIGNNVQVRFLFRARTKLLMLCKSKFFKAILILGDASGDN